VIEGVFTPKGDASHGSLLPTGACYRKTFTLPVADKGKALWLDFDGVYRDSIVYLNGQKLGQHPCGYTPFHYDISRVASFGPGSKNVLAIQVNAQKQEGWWYEGGGIYRHVWLTKTDPVHIAPWGTFVTANLPEPTADKPPTEATVRGQNHACRAGCAYGKRRLRCCLHRAGHERQSRGKRHQNGHAAAARERFRHNTAGHRDPPRSLVDRDTEPVPTPH
jgi:beta-galactosidase/beta-glucuronidase